MKQINEYLKAVSYTTIISMLWYGMENGFYSLWMGF